MEKFTNRLFFAVFSLLGLAALFAALFLGATHQFFMAALCGIAALSIWPDIKKDINPKSKYNNYGKEK
jgi:membrane protein implicated in regulation of membrane protease activity